MVTHIERGNGLDHIERYSELRMLRSGYDTLGIHYTERGPLIVRDGFFILIPKSGRKSILQKLHSTHLSTDGMNELYKGHFFWPPIGKEVDDLYKNCKARKT